MRRTLGHPSAGEGAKGPRLCEGARLPLGFSKNDDVERWVLLRKNLRDPKAPAYYFVHAPKGTSLAEIAGAAGLRWTIEACFLRAKDDLDLDHCEARSWHGWHRHMTLVPITQSGPPQPLSGCGHDGDAIIKPKQPSAIEKD